MTTGEQNEIEHDRKENARLRRRIAKLESVPVELGFADLVAAFQEANSERAFRAESGDRPYPQRAGKPVPREPTMDMLVAGWRLDKRAEHVWRAMWDAAENDGPHTGRNGNAESCHAWPRASQVEPLVGWN
jgi:hypothetical protein